MKRAAILFLLLVPLMIFGQTVSYWFQGWQRKPDAKQAQEYFMVPGANVAFTYATNHVIINAVGGGGLFQLTGDVLGGVGVPVPTTLAVIGAGGVNTKITFDTKGRVTASAAAQLASADFVNQGSTTTLLHGNAAGNPSWAKVDLANEVSGSLANASLANSSVTYNGTTVALGASGTLTLASANFQNQGTTTTVLHGNAVGNPSWAGVSSADLTGTFPFWGTSGNALGGSTFFLGSTDNQPFSLKVNNVEVARFNTDKSINLNSSGASEHMDGPVYSGNTINSTNSGSVIPYTYYAEQNVGLVAAGQMPMGCWGCISAFGAATRVNLGNAVTQNTYYPITNYNHVVTNHWVANTWTTTNGILMNVFAGYYRITFAFSGRGGTGDQLEVDVATNNVPSDVIAAHGSSGAGAGKDISMSGTGILYLPAATKVGLRVQDTSASAAITVSHAAITVGTP